MDNPIKRRGRPPLSPEEREAHRILKNKRDNERKKQQGYVAQKRYRENHKGELYEPKLKIPFEKKNDLLELLRSTGLTMTDLFVGAVEEKYKINLHKDVDKTD